MAAQRNVQGNARYGQMAQAFHWVTAVLILVALFMAQGIGDARVFEIDGLRSAIA